MYAFNDNELISMINESRQLIMSQNTLFIIKQFTTVYYMNCIDIRQYNYIVIMG